jgi:hypothetical protein
MAQRKPIFQLKADYDPTELTTVRVQQTYADGSVVKREIPKKDGTSMEPVFKKILSPSGSAMNLHGRPIHMESRYSLVWETDDWNSDDSVKVRSFRMEPLFFGVQNCFF